MLAMNSCLSQMVKGHVDSRASRQSRSIREFNIEEEHKKLQEKFSSGDDLKIVRIKRPDE